MSVSDLEHDVKRFEKAAIDSQGLRYSEAQKVLLEYENIQKPYQFFIHVLENSTINLALYYAATFMTRTLVREWPILQDNEKQSLRDFLVNYLAERNETLEQSVKNQLLHCFSVIQKRMWLETQNNMAEASINLLKQMMEHNISTKELALRIMLDMVNEFSFSRSSDIGMSFEFHYKTRLSFQKTILKDIFTICFESIMNYAPLLNSASSDDRLPISKLIRVALKLLEQILRWDFAEFSLSNTFTKARQQQQQNQALGQLRLKPSGSLQGVINDVTVLKGLFDVSGVPMEDPECVHSIYQSLIQMGTVPKQCFASDDQCRDYYDLYVKGILHLTSSCLNPNGGINNDEHCGHKVHTVSHMVSAAMITLGIQRFLLLPESDAAIRQLGQFTLAVIRASARSLDEWFIESSEQLLSAWSFIVDQLELVDKSQLPQQQLQLLIECCNAFFHSFVESRLRYKSISEQQNNNNNTNNNNNGGGYSRRGYTTELAQTIGGMLKVGTTRRISMEDLLRVPHVRLKLRERRLNQHYNLLKRKEEELSRREREVAARERRIQEQEKVLERNGYQTFSSDESHLTDGRPIIPRHFSEDKENRVPTEKMNHPLTDNRHQEESRSGAVWAAFRVPTIPSQTTE
eukprot:gb/GECH01007511.1/.p1 GENE.gb/GECH01007511.1/~~gb/GECH01007511.1/.p1  ORF type:complete len:631 (+),score=171.26 gb/GECH01007511.1/:1-1893(+)